MKKEALIVLGLALVCSGIMFSFYIEPAQPQLASTCLFSGPTLSTCQILSPDFKCGVDNATGKKLGECD